MISESFETFITASSEIEIPESIALPFYEKGHKRVQLMASSKDQTLLVHVALRKVKGNFVVYFGKRNWKSMGLELGDSLILQLQEDNTKYGVEMPEALQAVLDSDWDAYEIFKSLTDGKKRSIIYFIRRYKNPQTQVDKSLLLCERLKMGIRDPREWMKPNNT